MTSRQQLYVCAPCMVQQFADVPLGQKAPARACEKCAQPMHQCAPSRVQAFFRAYTLAQLQG
jgi:hypothetical protein